MFAGSLLNLEPGTEYECHFVLSDPDGVKGKAEKTVIARTRQEPQPAAGGHVYHVYPFGYKGTKQEPAFTGLLAAYYMGSDQSDHSNALPPRVQAGDIILVHAGVYKDSRFMYGGFDRNTPAYGTPFDGTYYLTQSGTADKPIVIKGAGDGEVVFDGDGCQNLFNLLAGNYNYFEGITVRNTNVAFLLGLKNIAGSSGFTLKHSRLDNIGRGVQDDWSGSKNFYIADNVFIGRHDPNKLQSWTDAQIWAKFPGYPAPITSEYAVKVYGQGHVVAYNYVANWHDGIDIATYGDPDGTPNAIPDRLPVSIDFYNNDFSNMADNCIEADGGARNIRVFRESLLQLGPGCVQRAAHLRRPGYFYRNLVYDATTGGPLKFIDTPAGVLVYQNTFVGQGRLMRPASNVHFLNNLFLGDGYLDPVFTRDHVHQLFDLGLQWIPSEPRCRSTPSSGTRRRWRLQPTTKGQQVTRQFKSLEEYQKATRQEQHSILLDYDVFVNVSIPDKSDPQRLYKPEDFDFRLKPGSRADRCGHCASVDYGRFHWSCAGSGRV